MMRQVKPDRSMHTSGYPVRASLPEHVVGADADRTPFPESSPMREVVVHELEAGHRRALQPGLDRGAIVCAREHPDLVISGGLQGPIPSDPRLRPFVRLTGVGGQQDPERLTRALEG